jgi:hypothetical protein
LPTRRPPSSGASSRCISARRGAAWGEGARRASEPRGCPVPRPAVQHIERPPNPDRRERRRPAPFQPRPFPHPAPEAARGVGGDERPADRPARHVRPRSGEPRVPRPRPHAAARGIGAGGAGLPSAPAVARA